MNYREFQKKTRSNDISNVYLFENDNDYLTSAYLRFLRQALQIEDNEPLDLFTSDEKDPRIEDIFANLLMMPYLHDYRLVIIKRDNVFNDGSLSNALLKYLDEPSETSVLVIVTKRSEDAKIDKKNHSTELYKKLSNFCVVEFDPFKGKDLEDWISASFKRRGLEIAPATVSYIVDASTPNISKATCDMGLIEKQIEKIALAKTGSKKVTLSDVMTYGSFVNDNDIFYLTNALASRDLQKAESAIEILLAKKENAVSIISVIASTFRRMALYSAMEKDGMSEQAIVQATKANSYAVKRSLEDAKRFIDPNNLVKILRELSYYDVLLKKGQIDNQAVLYIISKDICSLNFTINSTTALNNDFYMEI